jgi:hypothetical protein
MQAPVQVPPVPRYFMQPIVGREWAPGAEQSTAASVIQRPDKKSRRKAVTNPCLIQLTTSAVTRLRMSFWAIVS